MTDLQDAFNALSGKQTLYTTLYNYADGRHPLRYSTERLREAFRDIDTHFQQNWCAVIIDAAADRLNLAGWDAEDKGANGVLDNLWNEARIFLDSDEAHRDALITGEGFILAWKEGDTLDVYRNDPRLCAMFYDPARPKVKRFAAKWWADGAYWYMTLYYPDRLEYYAAQSKEAPSSANAFKPMNPPTAPNPFGQIPMFHYRSSGELGSVISLQDAVNKLFADMMVTAEFLAFPQRWYITNGDMTDIKNAPYEHQIIPPGDGQGQQSSTGQYPAADLGNYLNAIDKVASSMAIISRTPKHYFYSAGASLSGEALLAMEAPLTKKVERYQELFGVTWQELGAFLLRLLGEDQAEVSGITPIWRPAKSIQPYTEAQTRQLAVSAGIPLVTQLRWEGRQQSDIDAMQKDKQEEQRRVTATGQALLAQLRVQQEQDNNPTGSKNGSENNSQEDETS